MISGTTVFFMTYVLSVEEVISDAFTVGNNEVSAHVVSVLFLLHMVCIFSNLENISIDTGQYFV